MFLVLIVESMAFVVLLLVLLVLVDETFSEAVYLHVCVALVRFLIILALSFSGNCHSSLLLASNEISEESEGLEGAM